MMNITKWLAAATLSLVALGCHAQTNYRALFFNTNTGALATPWYRLWTNFNTNTFGTNSAGQLDVRDGAVSGLTNLVLDGLTGSLVDKVLTLTNAPATNLPTLTVSGETVLSNNLFGVDAVLTGTLTVPSVFGSLFGTWDRSGVGNLSGGAPYGGAQSRWTFNGFGSELFRISRHSTNANATKIYIPDRVAGFLLFKEDATNNMLWAVWQGATPTNNTFTGAPWTIHAAGTNLFINITGTNWLRVRGEDNWTD
jgi:hypothetical protein